MPSSYKTMEAFIFIACFFYKKKIESILLPLVEGPDKVGDKQAYSKSLLNLLSVEKVKSRKGLWDSWYMNLASSVVAQLN